MSLETGCSVAPVCQLRPPRILRPRLRLPEGENRLCHSKRCLSPHACQNARLLQNANVDRNAKVTSYEVASHELGVAVEKSDRPAVGAPKEPQPAARLLHPGVDARLEHLEPPLLES